MSVRVKFKCDSKTKYANGNSVKLTPVTSGSPENDKYFHYTPGGSLEIQTINDEAAAQFEPGKSYYIVITKEEP